MRKFYPSSVVLEAQCRVQWGVQVLCLRWHIAIHWVPLNKKKVNKGKLEVLKFKLVNFHHLQDPHYCKFRRFATNHLVSGVIKFLVQDGWIAELD